MCMPGLIPPASHCEVVVLKPLAEAPTLTCAGVIRLSSGRAAVIACSQQSVIIRLALHLSTLITSQYRRLMVISTMKQWCS